MLRMMFVKLHTALRLGGQEFEDVGGSLKKLEDGWRSSGMVQGEKDGGMGARGGSGGLR